jgi:hypothetical protein
MQWWMLERCAATTGRETSMVSLEIAPKDQSEARHGLLFFSYIIYCNIFIMILLQLHFDFKVLQELKKFAVQLIAHPNLLVVPNVTHRQTCIFQVFCNIVKNKNERIFLFTGRKHSDTLHPFVVLTTQW